HLSPKQKQLWKRLLVQVPAGVLSRSHAVIVEVAVSLWEKVSQNTAKPSEISQLRAILESFSMVPTNPNHQNVPDTPAETERERQARQVKEALAAHRKRG